ncbi:sugar ABC transporter permease [bacterium]|nr:sugar ABC transporter permease [bacterium]
MKLLQPISSPLVFVMPWIIVFSVFWLYPIVYSFYLSFTDYSLVSPETTRWIGIENYRGMLSDETFRLSLKNTLIFCAGTIPVITALAILLANAIHQAASFQAFFRSSVFLPSMISVTVLSLIFVQLYSQDGYLSFLARLVGIQTGQEGILLNENTALAGIMGMDIFIGTGYFCILFLAAIKNISADLYESADICGASSWQKFRYITLPLIRPMILFSIVIGTIKGFQIFTEMYIMTKGGPLHSTTTVIYYIYELAFRDFRMGYASAVAYILLIIMGVLAWVQIGIFNKKDT